MAVLSGTLTINAAFLADIKEDNSRLRELLNVAVSDAIQKTFDRFSSRNRVEMYHAIRDQLGLHFALEDAYGYFHDALEDNPWLTSSAEKLQGQHDSLFLQMCVIVDAAESILYREYNAIRETDLLRAFLEFYGRFIEHEHAENELILAVFNDDIGFGD